jgi:hypothetical protein
MSNHGRRALLIGTCLILGACSEPKMDDAEIRAQNAEHIDPTEQKHTGPIIRTSKQVVDQVQARIAAQDSPFLERQKPAAIYRRDAHSKGHGCVRASFHVRDDLPKAVKNIGIFKSDETYESWIRYSSGNGMLQSDEVKDARGMAIKLMGVEGKKLLNSRHGREEEVQDFLMINFPQFFLDNLEDYQLFAKLQADGSEFGYFIPGVNLFKWRWKELWIGLGVLGQRPPPPFGTLPLNPLYQEYHSMTPYALGVSQYGDEPRDPLNVVRHSVEGVSCDDLESAPGVVGKQGKKGDSFLRSNMATHLESAEACFIFKLHFQNPLENMPVEDPTLVWEDAKTIHAATITIPKQEFNSDVEREFCEQMSFSPWNGLPAHRPLGAINRIRKAVYEEISLYRHMLNVPPGDANDCDASGAPPRRHIFQPTGWCVTKNECGEAIANDQCDLYLTRGRNTVNKVTDI